MEKLVTVRELFRETEKYAGKFVSSSGRQKNMQAKR